MKNSIRYSLLLFSIILGCICLFPPFYFYKTAFYQSKKIKIGGYDSYDFLFHFNSNRELLLNVFIFQIILAAIGTFILFLLFKNILDKKKG